MMLFWASKSENVFKDYSSSGEKNQKWERLEFPQLEISVNTVKRESDGLIRKNNRKLE